MKLRNYENKIIIRVLIFFLIVIEMIFIIFLHKYKFFSYKSMNCLVRNKNTCLLIINDNDKKILYKNSNLYLNDNLLEYKIYEDNGVIITKGNKKYYEVLIKLKFKKKYKTNDSITIVLKNKKIQLVKIFNIIWEGDNN